MSKKTTIALATLTAFSLSACQTMPPCDDSAAAPNPTKPRVSIVDDRHIVVDQEPLVFAKDKVNVQIVWQLPKDGAYRFPENGIVFEKSPRGEDVSVEITECRPIESGLKFTCMNRHTKPGDYKYTINVQRRDGKSLEPLDPRVVNM